VICGFRGHSPVGNVLKLDFSHRCAAVGKVLILISEHSCGASYSRAALTHNLLATAKFLVRRVVWCADDSDVTTYNAALNRPAYMRGVWQDKYFAHLANDGDLETNYQVDGVPKCAHTNYEANPWWAVDLGRPLKVYKVYFTNRKDKESGMK